MMRHVRKDKDAAAAVSARRSLRIMELYLKIACAAVALATAIFKLAGLLSNALQ